MGDIMLYQSTRNNNEQISASGAILRGIAPDGGLYMLNSFEGLDFDWKKNTFNVYLRDCGIRSLYPFH